MKRIFFRVDGDNGKKVGMGHIIRSLILYQNLILKLKKDKFKVIFLMKNYEEGIKFLKKNTKSEICLFNKKFLNQFTLKKSDIFIIDTLGAEKELLKKIFNKKIKKIISFDETNFTRYKSGIIFNGIYFFKKNNKKHFKNLKIYQGLKYLILNKEYQKKIKKIIHSKNIIISSGGADNKNMLVTLTKMVENLKTYQKIFVIVGPGVKKNNPIFKYKKKKTTQIIVRPKNLKNYFDQATICLVSGGNVMFESILQKKKVYVVKLYNNQKYAIRYFKKKGVIKYLGDFKNINYKNLKAALFTQVKFKKLNEKFDGRGLNRVISKIIPFINN
jgi:spore coat polysaccharide biosynthesis predicted glycosyltransferase SpsG